jgi:single-strand DNA-binding protein
MATFNRVILIGNLVRDPDVRYVQSGAPVATFTIAVNHRTQQSDSVHYIDIVAWKKLAETANAYLKKGMLVLVEGRLATRSYESKGGEKHKAAEVVVNFMQMLSPAPNESARAADTPPEKEQAAPA